LKNLISSFKIADLFVPILYFRIELVVKFASYSISLKFPIASYLETLELFSSFLTWFSLFTFQSPFPKCYILRITASDFFSALLIYHCKLRCSKIHLPCTARIYHFELVCICITLLDFILCVAHLLM